MRQKISLNVEGSAPARLRYGSVSRCELGPVRKLHSEANDRNGNIENTKCLGR
jgi:hypothetical protein